MNPTLSRWSSGTGGGFLFGVGLLFAILVVALIARWLGVDWPKLF